MPDPAPVKNQGTQNLLGSVTLVASAFLTGLSIAWLDAHGFATTDIIFLGYTVSPKILIGGAVFTTLSAITTGFWSWLRGTQIAKLFEQHQVVAVQAGINLAMADQAVTVVTPEGERVPKPVTPETAKIIVQAFGPSTPPPVVEPTPADLDPVEATRRLNLRLPLKP